MSVQAAVKEEANGESGEQVVTAEYVARVKDEDEEDVAEQTSKYPPSVIVSTKLLIGSWV